MNYISPCNHPESYLSGSTIESMIDRAVELGNTHFTCTDDGVMSGSLRAYTYAKKKGIKFIPGVELYFRDTKCKIIEDTESARIKYFKVLIHAKDQAAYQELCRLVSDTNRNTVRVGENHYPLYTWKDLENIAKFNITICTSNIEGMVAKHLLCNRADLGLKYYEKLRNLVGPENFYPTIIPFEYDKYWDSMVKIKVGGKEVEIPGEDRVDTDSKYRGIKKAKDVMRNGHNKLTHVFINNLRFKVKDEFQEIEERSVYNKFVDMPGGDIQLKANRFIMALAEKYGDTDRLLINNYAYYAKKSDKVVQDMKLGEKSRIYQHQYMAGIEDVQEYLDKNLGLNNGKLEQVVSNSYKFAAQFDEFQLKYDYRLPDPGPNPEKQLVEIIKKVGRMKWDDERYVTQFKEEYKLLTENGVVNLVPYFLPIVDVYDFYKENGHLTGPARGSAGGFLISYLIGITHIDPIKYGLSTSRFLTLDRVQQGNLPDIDCDLESRVPLVGKDGNSGYLYERYGNKAAQVSTRTLLRIKSAILDANRFIGKGLVEDEITALSKGLPNTPQGVSDNKFVFGYEEDGNHFPGLLEKDSKLQKYAQERPEEWDIVKRCLSLARQNSRHACAYVISDAPIEDTLPIMEVGGVKRVTQPEAKQCEWAGMIKYDFLVVSALRDINLCIKLINEKNGKVDKYDTIGWIHHESDSHGCAKCHPDIIKELKDEATNRDLVEPITLSCPHSELVCPDCGLKIKDTVNKELETGSFYHNGKETYIWDLPEDPEVFKMLGDGHTESVFQLNTTSVTPFVKKIKPQNIIDCATITSLVRPGPLDFIDEKTGRNMVEEYVERKYGRSKSDIPILDKMLPETHGVLVFQEQVTKLAKELAGLGVEDSENVRIAVGKKKEDLIKSLKPKFIEGAAKKVGIETATTIWNMMETFARYGFNKSHAVAYSVISYACAFLKKHYLLEWWAAVLSNADNKEINEVFYKYVKDMVLPPDVNTSTEKMTVDYNEGKIRNKLSIISGLGSSAAHKIMAGRPYADIKDFVKKKTCGPSMTKKLIHIGVLDSLFSKEDDLETKITKYAEAVEQVRFENKLEEYEAKINNADNQKDIDRITKLKAKYIEKGPKEPKVDMDYIGLSAKQDFLIKKSVFPTMNIDLQKVIDKSSKLPILRNNRTGGLSVPDSKGKDVIVMRGEDLQTIDGKILSNNAYFAVPGYVVDTGYFSYHGTKKAFKVLIDSSGYISEKVIWPDYETGELNPPEWLQKGAIAWFYYFKKEGSKYTNIQDMLLEQEPIK